MLFDPLAIFTKIFDFQHDMAEFAAFGSVYENLSRCKFEETVLDLLSLCTKHPDQCAFGNLMQNLSKNMFVLVGKVTSLGETFQGFPANDPQEFKEQMKELGEDAGTWVRVMFDYRKEQQDEPEPVPVQPEQPSGPSQEEIEAQKKKD